MPDPQHRLAALEEQMEEFRARLTTVEGLLSSSAQAGAPDGDNLAQIRAAPSDRESFQQAGTVQGMLNTTAFIQVDQQRYQGQHRQSVQSLFEAAPDPLVQVFAALANPHRVIILRLLCEGPRTALQLQESLEMGSVGQLYHHLKELGAAGLITQRGRGAYTIDPDKMILVCLALMAAFRLTHTQQGAESPAPSPHKEEDSPGNT